MEAMSRWMWLAILVAACARAPGGSSGVDAGAAGDAGADAAAPDAATPDAATIDAGSSDAAAFDGGATDGGNSDAGVPPTCAADKSRLRVGEVATLTCTPATTFSWSRLPAIGQLLDRGGGQA